MYIHLEMIIIACRTILGQIFLNSAYCNNRRQELDQYNNRENKRRTWMAVQGMRTQSIVPRISFWGLMGSSGHQNSSLYMKKYPQHQNRDLLAAIFSGLSTSLT